MTCIGLISDTHVPNRLPAIPPAVFEHLDGVDLILHAGDVDDPAILGVVTVLIFIQIVAAAPIGTWMGSKFAGDGDSGDEDSGGEDSGGEEARGVESAAEGGA